VQQRTSNSLKNHAKNSPPPFKDASIQNPDSASTGTG
jgi:hypothetical protein